MFPKKRIPTIMCCTILLAIVLFSLTGCGGGGGGDDDDDPVVYRLAKVEVYDSANDTTVNYTQTMKYDKSGTPIQQTATDGTKTLVAELAVTFENGLLKSSKLSWTDGTAFWKINKYDEHDAAGNLTKYTSYANDDASDKGNSYYIIKNENGKRSTAEVYEYINGGSSPGYPSSPSQYVKYVIVGGRITGIEYYSDSVYGNKTYYSEFVYDSNGNIANETDYEKDENGNVNVDGYTVYTWEKAKSTVNWNDYLILLPE